MRAAISARFTSTGAGSYDSNACTHPSIPAFLASSRRSAAAAAASVSSISRSDVDNAKTHIPVRAHDDPLAYASTRPTSIVFTQCARTRPLTSSGMVGSATTRSSAQQRRSSASSSRAFVPRARFPRGMREESSERFFVSLVRAIARGKRGSPRASRARV